MKELQELVEISKYAGSRWDLVQAGGGNSSVKSDTGKLYIKASGVCLADVSLNSGYTILDNTKLLRAFHKLMHQTYKTKELTAQRATRAMSKCQIFDKGKNPSLEIWMHAILKKYTLHIHPIVINALVCRKDWKQTLKQVFSGVSYATISYKTPGIELAFELKKVLRRTPADIIFLQNHGLIVTSNQKEKIKLMTEFILTRAERYLSLDMTPYKITNELSKNYNEVAGTT